MARIDARDAVALPQQLSHNGSRAGRCHRRRRRRDARWDGRRLSAGGICDSLVPARRPRGLRGDRLGVRAEPQSGFVVRRRPAPSRATRDMPSRSALRSLRACPGSRWHAGAAPRAQGVFAVSAHAATAVSTSRVLRTHMPHPRGEDATTRTRMLPVRAVPRNTVRRDPPPCSASYLWPLSATTANR